MIFQGALRCKHELCLPPNSKCRWIWTTGLLALERQTLGNPCGTRREQGPVFRQFVMMTAKKLLPGLVSPGNESAVTMAASCTRRLLSDRTGVGVAKYFLQRITADTVPKKLGDSGSDKLLIPHLRLLWLRAAEEDRSAELT